MNRIHAVTSICLVIILSFLTGCGYTILRDYDEEARQAEWAIIDSLTEAPDLTISSIEYDYIPVQNDWYHPNDFTWVPARVRFYITVSNVGNADFDKPYLLVLGPSNPRQYYHRSIGAIKNKEREVIPADGEHEIELTLSYPYATASYSFSIVTNYVIQYELMLTLDFHSRHSLTPPLSRELWYDNNEASITIPGLREVKQGEEQL